VKRADLELLLDHLYWMRHQIAAAAQSMPADDFLSTAAANGRDLRQTLVHELDVEWSWRQRLSSAPAEASGAEAELKPADYPTLDSILDHWRRDESEMRSWLAGLTDSELEAEPADPRLHGFPLWQYAYHMIAHGVEQLTAASVILSAVGRSPGDLDFLNAMDARRNG
jgi:uncharacterized damage-inducible protein DinB